MTKIAWTIQLEANKMVMIFEKMKHLQLYQNLQHTPFYACLTAWVAEDLLHFVVVSQYSS